MREGDGRARREACPICGQPLGKQRFGANLTALKIRILDHVARAGDDGILKADLMAIMNMNHACLKSHLGQINRAINGSGHRLYSRAKTVFLINGPPPRKRWWR